MISKMQLLITFRVLFLFIECIFSARLHGINLPHSKKEKCTAAFIVYKATSNRNRPSFIQTEIPKNNTRSIRTLIEMHRTAEIDWNLRRNKGKEEINNNLNSCKLIIKVANAWHGRMAICFRIIKNTSKRVLRVCLNILKTIKLNSYRWKMRVKNARLMWTLKCPMGKILAKELRKKGRTFWKT